MLSYPGSSERGRPSSLGKTRAVELALGNRNVSHKDPTSPSFPTRSQEPGGGSACHLHRLGANSEVRRAGGAATRVYARTPILERRGGKYYISQQAVRPAPRDVPFPLQPLAPRPASPSAPEHHACAPQVRAMLGQFESQRGRRSPLWRRRMLRASGVWGATVTKLGCFVASPVR